ncbi:hypothetical protein [Rhizobium sp. 9140]|uniref:hypothetical protein n=1 Tax=Rhizobium sp. 9140 TaxID=1761900 RepID=UPI000795274F|nr:hypothetical protein [Rhizobium sp. 9140]CZT35894.1 hypothetical protein GA0004734_00029000 [Rhizobium sp. 9140]
MQDVTFFAFLGLQPAETLLEIRALSEAPMAGANVVSFLPRRVRSCHQGVASGQCGVIVRFPQRGKPAAPETMTKEM